MANPSLQPIAAPSPRAILICPIPSWEAPVTPALMPMLGRIALDRAMSRLHTAGARSVLVLAADRPEEIRAALQDGTPWGLHAEVLPQRQTPTPAEARAQHQAIKSQWLEQSDADMLLCPWPIDPTGSQWPAPAAWFSHLVESMASFATDTVTMHQRHPGVWVSTQASIATDATLLAPCWIGPRARIANGATIGPHAVIEARAIIDAVAEVSHSHVGPDTYVAPGLALSHNIAWGRRLLHQHSGFVTTLRDGMLLEDLSRRTHIRRGTLLGRLVAGLALLLTWPILLLAWVKSRCQRRPLFHTRRALLTPAHGALDDCDTIAWTQFDVFRGWLRRWPELLLIWRGQFAWMANRPLTRDQADTLTDESARLWLALPPGLFSYGESLGCDSLDSDEARAHAAYYAATRTVRSDLFALARIALRMLLPARSSAEASSSLPSFTPNPSTPAQT